MSRKNIKNFALLVALPAILLLGACGSEAEESGAATTETGSSAVIAGAPKGAKGSMAPDFNLPRLDGGTLQLSSLRGKTVIVDFWDTWCPPCIKALPHLQELSETYADDLVVVGIAFGREGEAKVRSFTQKNGLTFEMVLLADQPQVMEAFGGIQSIPTTFLIDTEGVIQQRWVGGYPKASYEEAIKAVLGS